MVRWFVWLLFRFFDSFYVIVNVIVVGIIILKEWMFGGSFWVIMWYCFVCESSIRLDRCLGCYWMVIIYVNCGIIRVGYIL